MYSSGFLEMTLYKVASKSVCVRAFRYLFSFLFVSSNFSASFFSRSRDSSFRSASACFRVGALSSLPFATQSSVSVCLIFSSSYASPIFWASLRAACAVFNATSGYSAMHAIRCSMATSPNLLPEALHDSTNFFTVSNPAFAPLTAVVATMTALIMDATPAVFPDFSSAASSSSATVRPSCGVSLMMLASTIISAAEAANGPLPMSLAPANASFADDIAAWESPFAR
mmetsp:Transcript_74657/g.241403  ORF Transcript_74657/g.241403 Transcript_74657/m.241403 type:complete len:227 (+) Transcript_74657:457-1137(+)